MAMQVHKLCKHYGPFIGYIEDEPFHDFPRPEDLLGQNVESELRNLGFGYRAKYIATTSRMVAEKPKGWLDSLRNPCNPGFRTTASAESSLHMTYKEARQELQQLAGVGPKVADCVCLMGWGEAVPIDTHVWQIAQRDYKFGKGKSKTFNTGMYDAVGDFFRDIWGSEAGWAHSVLFTADLKSFSGQQVPKTATEVKVEVKVEVNEEVVEEVMVESKKRSRTTTVINEMEEPMLETTERRRTRSRK
jgi:N-glycosylase/DNA lyase